MSLFFEMYNADFTLASLFGVNQGKKLFVLQIPGYTSEYFYFRWYWKSVIDSK